MSTNRGRLPRPKPPAVNIRASSVPAAFRQRFSYGELYRKREDFRKLSANGLLQAEISIEQERGAAVRSSAVFSYRAPQQRSERSPAAKANGTAEERRRKKSRTASEVRLPSQEDMQPRGFDRGLEPERIVGARDSNRELIFLIKWENTNEADLDPSRLATVKCHRVVIQLYTQGEVELAHELKCEI
ncbi:hypothetical protein MRX96_006200 [Rhipicephalus microplus]